MYTQQSGFLRNVHRFVCVGCAEMRDGCCSESGAAVCVATEHNRPPFGVAVLHVVPVCPEEQMLRPDALGVIAPMAGQQTRVDRSVYQSVGDPVSLLHLPVEAEQAVPP